MNFKKQYTNTEKTEYKIKQIFSDGRERYISEDQVDYLIWLSNGNIAEEIDYTAPIIPEIPIINPERRFENYSYQNKIAAIVAYRMNQAGYSLELCTGVMASVVAVLKKDVADRTESDLQRLAEGDAIEGLRQSIIAQVYTDYPPA